MAELERRLELPSVVAISISAMLGSGIFVLPGLAAAKTGPSLWLAYVVAGLCVLPATLSKSELATAMPTSGGTYVYIDRVFGPLAGTISGLGLWLSLLLKSSFALVGFSAYLFVIVDLPVKQTAIAILLVIMALNIRGIRGVSRVQVIVMVISIAGLAALSLLGISTVDATRFDNSFPEGGFGFLSAVAFVFISFAGVTKVAAIAEEVRRPERNLPAGMLLSIAIATVIYAAISLVIVGNIPMADLAGDVRPVYTLAQSVSTYAPIAIGAAALGVLTMTSMANAGLLAASRFPFAMSRDDLLPPILSKLHSRYLTPVACILLSGAVMAAAIVFLDIEGIAKLASAFKIMLFILVNLAVIVLRETRVQWYKPQFRSPFYPWVQLFGVVSGAALMFVLGGTALIAMLAIAVPGVALFLVYGRHRTERKGVVGQRGPRTELLGADPVTAPVELGDLAPVAEVLVAMFGTERSPEMLVEVGHALAEGEHIQVMLMTEIPEQITHDAIATGDHPRVHSVRRRITAMAEDQGMSLDFGASTSRDIVRTVNDLTRQLECHWLVLEWGGRDRFTYTVSDPLGWLTEHVSCNLATFYDAGVRYIRRILVHAQPGPHDALVLGTADHLGRFHGAKVTFVRVLPESADTAARQSAADYLDQVRELCTAENEAELIIADGEESALAHESRSHDLLITAAAPRGTIWRRLRGTNLDRLTELAACSVLRLQAPRASSHATFEKYRASSSSDVAGFIDYIDPSCACAQVDIKKKEAVFQFFAEKLAENLPQVHPEQIVAGLWERERTQNTALGDGIALPHATLVDAGHTHLGVFVTKEPVEYKAPDGRGVDIFFVTLGTPGDRQEHLTMLSSIARLCTMTSLIERLRAAESNEEVMTAIRESAEEIGL